jgi:tetratricopeptide (TPR) repeat protein
MGEMAPRPSGALSAALEEPGGRGAVPAVAGPPPAATGDVGDEAAKQALDLRDQALAALDSGDPLAALAMTGDGLAALRAAELDAGPDAAAVLSARAEIEECLDRFADAAATSAAAIAILDHVTEAGDDEDCLLAGEFAAAAARLGAVLDRASAAFGENSPAVVSAANALGVVHKTGGDFGAAQAAYQRAMAAAGDDADPLILAGLLHNLGGLAHARGDAAGGIPVAERGAALRTEALGAGHPDVARDLNALGALYHLAGRLDDAAAAYTKALAVFEKCYGPQHFEVAMTCANLAVLHGDQGRDAGAEALGRRSLAIFEAILGPEDAEVGLTLLNLAAAVADQGRAAEAAELAARAAAILTARLPGDHPHVAAAVQALDRFKAPS